MSFVGTRPEAVKYVKQYKPEYNATLLMPAGITSEAMYLFHQQIIYLTCSTLNGRLNPWIHAGVNFYSGYIWAFAN